MDWLLDPLNYEFMRQALMAGVLMGILCPIVGTYLLVQRMAILGDVVAHAVLPGLAICRSDIVRLFSQRSAAHGSMFRYPGYPASGCNQHSMM